MDLGHELVKEQLFFRKEMMERVSWMIRLRWMAVAAGFSGCLIGYAANWPLPFVPLNLIFVFITLYNVLFFFIEHRLPSIKPQAVQAFTIFAHAQIVLDLFALYAILYFTGGIHSPFLVFFLFHIILAGILFSPLSCFIYSILVLLAAAGLILIQKYAILPPQPILFESHLFPRNLALRDIFVSNIVLAAVVLITAFLITSIKLSLRAKGRELLRVSKELDSGNAKLKALYQMAKEMGLCQELQAMMDSATRNAATIMGVKACSIKLLDEQRRRLRFSSTYGLSEDYVGRGSINLEKSPINRSIIEGSYYAIGRIDQKDYFQYPEDIRQEGIASMLCLPLRVGKMVLGVFCVYSDVTHDFKDEDVEFFLLMTDLTALAIENLRTELNKTWFLEKAAHQLRSPLNAIDTMLKTLRQGYLGPTQTEQAKLIARCEQRIENLCQVIADLLDLGVKRTDLGKITMHPVNLGDVVRTLVHLYQSQAAAKNLNFSCDIEECLPDIMAKEKLIDELLNNLISNAIKYTPSGGRVRIRVARESCDRILCEIADTGIGIPPEDISRLFTEFFRSKNAKELTEEGTGLGLVIVKEILDRLRGTIAVNSKLDEGTCFTCFFPVIDGP
ncbi:MAG: GAF domain-containing protein [Desulfobacterales bacterium]|nr:MAG: GAF domain-containing protein [Desulfobacterales bacterium]